MSEQVKTFQTMPDYFKQWKVQPLIMVEGINTTKEFNPLLPSYFPSSYLPGDFDDQGFEGDGYGKELPPPPYQKKPPT
jgi:hypothetical protein